jgi:hypothetical protein
LCERRPEAKRVDEIRVVRRQHAGFQTRQERRQVDASAEIRPNAVQDRSAQPVVMVELIIGLADPDDDRRIEAILGLRPVDADQQEAAAPLHVNRAWRGALSCRLIWRRLRERTPGAQPATVHPTRSFAIMHAAIYDAVNGIDGTHKPYLVRLSASHFASQEASAAAHEVLVKL